MGKKYTSTRASEPLGVLLASRLAERMTEFGEGLAENAEVEIYQADSSEKALGVLAGHTIDLIVIDHEVKDMAGLDVAQKVAREHPFVSSVLVSGLAHDDFHEETEGLGVLMSLPDPPDRGSALEVLEHMAKAFAAKTL